MKTRAKGANRKATARGSDRKSGRKTDRNIGDEIIQGLKEAVAYERGELAEPVRVMRVPLSARKADAAPAPDYSKDQIAKIRDRLNLSQPVFAKVLNVSAETAKAWEQGKVPPSGSAKRLLQIAEKHPDVVLELIVRK